jgi:tellurite resistance protein TerC
LIEQSLSIDNMFVFVMIFSYFAVPPELQRRVLLYGVLGAIQASGTATHASAGNPIGSRSLNALRLEKRAP